MYKISFEELIKFALSISRMGFIEASVVEDIINLTINETNKAIVYNTEIKKIISISDFYKERFIEFLSKPI
jgi:hypothetical protein